MVHTIQNLKTSNLNPDFESQQLLGSLKHVINIVMRIWDMRCYNKPLLNISINNLLMYEREVPHASGTYHLTYIDDYQLSITHLVEKR
jgi:hypothetical protein